MDRIIHRPTVLLLTVGALLALSAGLQAVRDGRYEVGGVERAVLYVRSGEALRRLTLSYNAIAADVYWIRTIQHYGGDRLSDRERRYQLLYPLLDITTTLDPRFTIAYRFGALFLAEAPPGGPGRPDLAIALLEKGLRVEPHRWEYAQDIGFVHYWQRGDYETAAHWFARAGEMPGAPAWLPALAATTLAKGGSREASRFLWQQIHDTADQDWLRATAEWRLAQLDALDEAEALTRLAQAYRERHPGRLLSWDQLVRAGLLRDVPLDPAGTPFHLGADDGRVEVSGDSPLRPLPAEPAGRAPEAVPDGSGGQS
jgi:tetratricopeptide (TPR) repeat protein